MTDDIYVAINNVVQNCQKYTTSPGTLHKTQTRITVQVIKTIYGEL